MEMPVRINPELERLALTDTLAARTNLYLRLLHTSHAFSSLTSLDAAGRLPERTRQLFRSIDPELLELERAARTRSLRSRLLREIPSLARLLPEGTLDAYVEAFVDSQEFWAPRGRSLGESFCFDTEADPALRGATRAELLRLYGVIAGLSAAPERASPWTGEIPQPGALPGAQASEGFVAASPLLAALKELDAGHMTGGFEDAASRPRLVVVTLFPEGRIKLFEAGV